MKKKNIKKVKNAILILSILISVAFPAGIVATVLGAVNENTLIMVLGLVFLVVSFFALPFTWIGFGGLVTKSKIYEAITVRNVTDINTLAQIFNKHPNEIRNAVNKLISKGYLEYTLLYDKIEKPLTQKSKCPNCGANLKKENGKLICEYCKSEYEG